MHNRHLFPVALVTDGAPIEITPLIYSTKACQTPAPANPKHGTSGWLLRVEPCEDGSTDEMAEVVLVIYDAKDSNPGWYSRFDFERHKIARSDAWKISGTARARRRIRRFSLLERSGCYLGPCP